MGEDINRFYTSRPTGGGYLLRRHFRPSPLRPSLAGPAENEKTGQAIKKPQAGFSKTPLVQNQKAR